METRQGCLFSTVLFNTVLEVAARELDKKKKERKKRKEGGKKKKKGKEKKRQPD